MPVSLAAGVLAAALIPSLPPTWLVFGSALFAGLAAVSPRLRLPAFFVLSFCWALGCFAARLDDRLDPGLANQLVTLRGHVSSLPSTGPDYVRFQFEPESSETVSGLPTRLLISWYRDHPEIAVGQHWQLEVTVKPPWGSVNFQGHDRERWLFANGIGGAGTVRSGQLLSAPVGGRFRINSIRERVTRRIAVSVNDERQRGVIQALATADRSGLDDTDRALLRATGTSHLLAISGLHVGLAAAGGMWLSRIFLLVLPISGSGISSLLVTVGSGLLGAAAYAALAGFGIPTLRSVLMLFTAVAAVLVGRSIHPSRALLVSLAVLLVIDPFAPLNAGFWFSFGAVTALLLVFQPRTGTLARWKILLTAQAAVLLMLLPLSALWFNTFSPSGFLANLLAIPWVSILVVPLVLAGLVALPVWPGLATFFWLAAGSAVSVLLEFLTLVSRWQGALPIIASPTVLTASLALAGAAVLLLPRGLPLRWLGFFLIAPLFLPPGQHGAAGLLTMEVLDAGQGTAALITSGRHVLLYDSGPGDGAGRDLVGSVIAPALAKFGSQAPDQIIISHGDMDHAGGLNTLLERYPASIYRVNIADQDDTLATCRAPEEWSWPELHFSLLHPSAGLPYIGNDSSCVVSVRGAGGGLLLSGDVSEAVEKRLLAEGLLPHRLMLVPHHGSSTSSSRTFVETLRPEVAIATAGLGNRFDFPRPEIRQRYRAQGIRFWSTGECGALSVKLHPDGAIEASSARRQRERIWRWPVAANCP